MNHFEPYYLNQACRGLSPTPVIGPIYSAPLYLQRGHDIGKYSAVSSAGWDLTCGVWAVQDPPRFSQNTSHEVHAEDIISKYVGDVVSKHVTESTQRLISKLRGRVANVSDGKRRRRRQAGEVKSLEKQPQSLPG